MTAASTDRWRSRSSSPEFATDPSFVERFRREAQAAANLAHPNIVGVYDWGTQDGTYFIVMEYVDGPSLSEVIRHDGPLHPRRAAEIASEVAAALGFAHSRGVVHRDVKPGNVLLTGTGQSKVTDFGIARALSSADEDLTQAGSVMGTATYFSPEQAQGLPVDPRSDLYSLGVVLYEMVTARPPFTGETPLAIAYKHVQDRPPPPTTIVPGLPLGARGRDHEAPREASRRPVRVGRGAARRPPPLRATASTPWPNGSSSGAATRPLRRRRTVQGARPLPPTDAIDDDPRRSKSRTGSVARPVVVLLLLLLGGGPVPPGPAPRGYGSGDGAADQGPDPGRSGEGPAPTWASRPRSRSEAERHGRGRPGDLVGPERQHRGRQGVDGEARRVDRARYRSRSRPSTNLPQAAAEKALTDAGLASPSGNGRERRRRAGHGRGPEPGARCRRSPGLAGGSAVSKASGQELVPDVSGQTLAAAQAALQADGLPGEHEGTDERHGRAGRVIGTDPAAGTSLKKNAVVTIIVSTGREQVKVPSVTGQTESDATETLKGRGSRSTSPPRTCRRTTRRTVGCSPRIRRPTSRWTPVRRCASPSARPPRPRRRRRPAPRRLRDAGLARLIR